MPLIDEGALASLVKEIVRAELARPVFCSQRSVEAVVGVPRRQFLRDARAQKFASTKEGRLIVSRTADVIRFYENQIALREAKPQNDHDPEALAFSRVGARRIAR